MYKILIVEDEQVIAEEVCKYLMKWGYQAEYVRDFQHVCKEVLEVEPHLILMDINLPGISGFGVLDILRRDPKTASIPVIALSANAVPREVEKGLQAGFFRYLTKPIKVVEFMDALDVAMHHAEENGLAGEPKKVR